jgi:hypothetical protein
MNNICSAPACPIILDSTCVFYSGANLVYTGVNTNDNLQLVLEKIDNKFRDAGLGYVFTNGLIQTAPGQPVKLGGLLVENTTINSQGFTFGLSGTIGSSAFITTGGTSSQFVKGDGSLDNGPYQPSGNYITALTGDGTASGPGSSVLTLATVFNAPATYGSATRVPIITVNAKGLVTNVTTTVISVPSSSVSINGDVFGFGNTGVPFNLTLQNVLATPGVYGSVSAIPVINVNSKGLITSISQVAIGSGGTVTSVAVTPGTGISASVANPTTTPNITITNTAPDQTVVLNNGAGINVTGTYPNFTIAATGGSIPTLQQVVNTGNGITNFGGVGNANIQSTNFTNGRTLLLNDNSAPAIKIVDNANASNFLQIDVDTLNIDGVSYNWSTIVNPPTSPLVALPFTTDHLATTNNQYVIGDVVYYVGNVYRCIANNDSLQPNLAPAYWTLLGAGFPLVQQPSDWNSTSGNNQILNKPTIPVGTVTSVGLSMPSAFIVANSPVTGADTLTVTGAGLATQYVRGDGQLANFPSTSGGGSSVAYYLNGSVSQGTFGGDVYYQLSKTPVFGAGTNFTRTSGAGNGYIASFISDVGDPSLLSIPAGNWTLEFYFNANGNGGNPRFYGELYKVDSLNVFTLIASESANPEFITNSTNVDQYFTSISVPQTTLLITDRIAVRIYVIPTTRNITLHTENSNLSEVLTTFSTGLTALNGLTEQVQFFATGTSGTDFAIISSGTSHTFNLPNASATARGVITTGTQTIAGTKTFSSNIKIPAVGSQLILQVASDGTVSGMPTATYASPAELIYVKGVTSAIQTQINSKQATLTNPVTGTGTIDEIAYFNTTGSTIASLPVATYPSLTELSYVKGVTSAVQTQLNNKGYVLGFFSNAWTIAAGQTYYIANFPRNPATSAGTSRVYIPKSGTITDALFSIYSAGLAGSNNTITVSIRLNNTTDYLIQANSTAAVNRTFTNNSLSIPVVVGDYIEIKMAVATPYTTVPTNNFPTANILIRTT